jgi:hypothetical protein
VPALAEIMECLARNVGLLDRERLNDDSGAAEEHFALALEHYGKFHIVAGADHTAIGDVDLLQVAIGLGFAKQNTNQRGNAQDHLGRPCSSYRSAE